MTSIEEKEKLIQSGNAHYSDMLSREPQPTTEHLAIYKDALTHYSCRLANEVMMLALHLSKQFAGKPIVLASLVRAGVPLGVMINRALKQLGHPSFHYGISIIRDRGIDEKALTEIEARHGAECLVFVDGWTGKGAIATQLMASLTGRKGYPKRPRLVVLADPCGMAWLSASHQDWLIPFGILGASVSGLISRSVWSATDYHGCVICHHLKNDECSVALVDEISQRQQHLNIDEIATIPSSNGLSNQLNERSNQVILNLQNTFNIDNVNRIKLGISEATRAVLRRVPDFILVTDINDPDVQLLVHLALKKGINISEVGADLDQYRAVTIIKKEE